MSSNPQIIKVYAAHGDGGERGVGPIIGYFSVRHAAEDYANGRGWYGGNGGVSDAWAIVTSQGIYALKSNHPIDLDLKKAKSDDDLRKETLALLSAEQKRVLGLTD